MSTIIDFFQFKRRGLGVPTLVLVDLHHDASDLRAYSGNPAVVDALENCRAALAHARANNFPVGFTRRVAPPESPTDTPSYPRWLKGFEPSRYDMIFERWRPSCYASTEFAEMAGYLGGDYVLAGQFAEMSCLSTAIDAFHRDHRPTFLSDALVAHSAEDFSPAMMQHAVSHIVSLYADVVTTQSWRITTARRVRVRE